MKTLNQLKFYHFALFLSVLFFISCSKSTESTDKPQASFTVSTTAISAITQTTATTGGSIIITSGSPVITEKGVCYATTANPTVNSQIVPISTSSLSSFTSNITGLTANTTYHVRAYAIDNAGVKYGSDVTFTTLTNTPTVVLPTVTTTAVTAIAQTTATAGGNITSNGNGTITASGVCYSTSQNPTTDDSHFVLTITSGSFTCDLSNLTANTTYYVRAYATNNAGTGYGTQVSFTTAMMAVPTITTYNVSVITGSTANCGGYITSQGSTSVTVSGLCWSTSSNPTISDSKTTDGALNGFGSTMTNLAPNTLYHVRAYATNSVGTGYGNDVTFTTSALAIGVFYQGGKIVYIFQSGDNGYVVGQIHGLIVSLNDLSAEMGAGKTGYPSYVQNTALGTGSANTTALINFNTYYSYTENYAAKMCRDYRGGDYIDWYLPSKDELNKLYLNSNVIGNFTNKYYWSSSEHDILTRDFWTITMWAQNLLTGNVVELGKSNLIAVRAIRSF